MAYIEVQDECKRYRAGGSVICANDHVSFSVERGELAIVLGASGAGKSTVLNILGGMDTCDEGRVSIDGTDIAGYSARELTRYRREDVGFVFQFYNLVQNLTARENVETGALDYRTGKQILQLLQDMSRVRGATTVIVTHNSAIAPIADRVIHMHDGRVTAVELNEQPQAIADIEW